LAGHQFLRVGKLERPLQAFVVAEILEPRQHGADLGCHGIVPVAMPAQKLFGLLPEVFEIGHGRIWVDVT